MDKAFSIHPTVAKLLTDILEDCIDEGNTDAMCCLGSLYYTGRAGEQDYEKAFYYYEMSDKAGNRKATENLGYIYYYGRKGEVNYEKSFNYFAKAALVGLICSLYKIGDFYRNGYYVEKDEKEAFSIYVQCLDKLDDDTIPESGADIDMRIGDCLYEGIGIEKDTMGALHFYNMAEELFYKRIIDGEDHLRGNLEHVVERQQNIREEIKDRMLG